MKFSIKDFFSKCDQIRRKLRIWSHLLKKSLMENFIFCAEGCFYSKLQITNHPGLIFNHNTVSLTKSQKHPRVALDSILDFQEHLKIIVKKANKMTGLLCKLLNCCPENH